MAFSGITQDIGIIFFILFIACSLFCVVAAEFDAVFTSIVMPVLSYTVSVPVFYLIQMSIKGLSGLKTALLTVAVPFVQSVPIMLAGFFGAFAIGLVRIGVFGARQGWDQLWIVSLFNAAGFGHKQARPAPKKHAQKSAPAGRSSRTRPSGSRGSSTPAAGRQPREKTPTRPTTTTTATATARTNTAPRADRSRTVTTPRPRPVGQRPATEMPRIAHPERTTPPPFGRYPGQQLQRQPQSPTPPPGRRLSPEELEDLRRRRRELALRVQRSRAPQGGRIPPQGGRIPPQGGMRRPHPDPRQAPAARASRIPAEGRRQPQAAQRSPHGAPRPRPPFPQEGGDGRRNPYTQPPQHFNPRGRQGSPERRNPYLQQPPYGKGPEPRYRKRRDER